MIGHTLAKEILEDIQKHTLGINKHLAILKNIFEQQYHFNACAQSIENLLYKIQMTLKQYDDQNHIKVLALQCSGEAQRFNTRIKALLEGIEEARTNLMTWIMPRQDALSHRTNEIRHHRQQIIYQLEQLAYLLYPSHFSMPHPPSNPVEPQMDQSYLSPPSPRKHRRDEPEQGKAKNHKKPCTTEPIDASQFVTLKTSLTIFSEDHFSAIKPTSPPKHTRDEAKDETVENQKKKRCRQKPEDAPLDVMDMDIDDASHPEHL